MTTRGIIYVAFGTDYCVLAANTIAYSRQFTDLPITVITNIPENLRCKKWAEIKGVSFVYLNLPIDENRAVKTQLHKYTPYDQTLYMDADAIIQKPGIEQVFDGLARAHIVFQLHTRWDKFKKYYEIYRRAAKKFDATLPLDVMLGGFFCFAKTPDVAAFFDLWQEYWKEFGKGRDMPPLACAIQNSGIKHTTITKQIDKLFSFGIDEECVVVHRVHGDDLKKFDMPIHRQNKPFDKNDLNDWAKVFFDLHENVWLIKKTNTMLADKRERTYIIRYLPEIRMGQKDILDIGAGFGQFLLCCRRYGNHAIGIVPPIEKYAGKVGINNSDSLDYETYARDRMEKNRLNFVECDFIDAIDTGILPIVGTFDIINCKHAINLIMKRHFNFKHPIAEYKNDGEWVFDEEFTASWHRLFELVARYLKPTGVFYVSALTATNAKKYAVAISQIAGHCGFAAKAENDGLNHRFTRISNAAA